jgi:hypothetical protein
VLRGRPASGDAIGGGRRHWRRAVGLGSGEVAWELRWNEGNLLGRLDLGMWGCGDGTTASSELGGHGDSGRRFWAMGRGFGSGRGGEGRRNQIFALERTGDSLSGGETTQRGDACDTDIESGDGVRRRVEQRKVGGAWQPREVPQWSGFG